MDSKQKVAAEVARRIGANDVIGVGTGSTVDAALDAIAERVKKEGIRPRVVTTSRQSAWKCNQIGLEVLDPTYGGEIVWGFDGADEVNGKLWCIKGKGAAMLQEKIVAARCKAFTLIVDESKVVENLGRACPIPVELIPSALPLVERGLLKLGATQVTIRPAGTGKHGPVITEAGNLVVDAKFSTINADLEGKIKSVVGVVESGLFIGYAQEVLVGSANGIRTLKASG